MFEANVENVLARIGPDDRVLDIGGWASPFNRANYVMDAEPFETRGFYGKIGLPASQGGEKEHFTEETWIVRDLCDREPYPFEDDFFDFVICSHTLEDLRDPLWVCSEIRRIGKRGYLEVPSRLAETCRGWEHPRIAGLAHHRWLIRFDDSHIDFVQKFHIIHSHWKLSFPESFFLRLSEAEKVQWMFWDGDFTFEERFIHGMDEQERELADFVASVRPYSAARLRLDSVMSRGGRLARRIVAGVRRRL